MKGEPLTALWGSQRGSSFLLPQYPTAEDFYKSVLQRENL